MSNENCSLVGLFVLSLNKCLNKKTLQKLQQVKEFRLTIWINSASLDEHNGAFKNNPSTHKHKLTARSTAQDQKKTF